MVRQAGGRIGLHHLDAGRAGQLRVDHDYVRVNLPADDERLLGRAGFTHHGQVFGKTEQLAESFSTSRVVVHQQNPDRARPVLA